MAVWIKNLGCDCPECGVDPCDPGCPCTFSVSRSDVGAGGSCNDTQTHDVTGEFIIAHDIEIFYDVINVTMTVNANGSPIWSNTSCNATGVATVTVPSGTTSLQIVISSSGCSGACEWTYTVGCV